METIALTHRTSYHSSIGDSPFYVLYGRDPVLPHDVELKTLDINSKPTKVRERLVVFNKLRKCVTYHQRREQNIAAEKYDKKHKEVHFEIGDLVFHPTRPHTRTSKFTWKWSPPQRIIAKLPNKVTFRVICTETGNESIWHCQNLVPFTRQAPVKSLKEELTSLEFPQPALTQQGDEEIIYSPASSVSSLEEEVTPLDHVDGNTNDTNPILLEKKGTNTKTKKGKRGTKRITSRTRKTQQVKNCYGAKT
eukprot:GHVN01075148.1.p1 GENE.GHVN01075148.1~~GHVN01075148.1.p1  ORF type:complete len:249 (+),score=2.73 GHVN01075148.1:23-769(+)